MGQSNPIATTHPIWRSLSYALLFVIGAIKLGIMLWSANRGFDLGDEGLYMLSLSDPEHYKVLARRWEIGESSIRGTVKGMTYKDANGEYTTVELTGYVKEFDADKHNLWPIPFRELNLNKNLTQNAGF